MQTSVWCMAPHHQRRLRAIGAALRPPPPSHCDWGGVPQMACCAVGYNETGGAGDNWPPILVPPGEEEHHAFDS